MLFQIGVTSIARQCRDARRAVRQRLARAGIEADHVVVVEEVAQELLVAVFDAGTSDPVILTVDPSRLLTHISVKTSTVVNVRDEPFGLRERILAKLTLAYGQQQHPNGTVDVWATVPRVHRP
jgi:hypothetical protein